MVYQKSDKGLISNTDTGVEQDSYTRLISLAELLPLEPIIPKDPENHPHGSKL